MLSQALASVLCAMASRRRRRIRIDWKAPGAPSFPVRGVIARVGSSREGNAARDLWTSKRNRFRPSQSRDNSVDPRTKYIMARGLPHPDAIYALYVYVHITINWYRHRK